MKYIYQSMFKLDTFTNELYYNINNNKMIETILRIFEEENRNSFQDILGAGTRTSRNIQKTRARLSQLKQSGTALLQHPLPKIQSILPQNKKTSHNSPMIEQIEKSVIPRRTPDQNQIEFSDKDYNQSKENTNFEKILIKGKISENKNKYIRGKIIYEAELSENAKYEQEETINRVIGELSQEGASGNQCVMCLEFLREGSTLKAINKSDCACLGMVDKYIFDKDLVQKLICSLANQGFGILFSSVSEGNNPEIKGYPFTETQKNYLVQMMSCIRKRIQPEIKIKIDFLPVYKTISALPEPNKKNDKFCLRIAVSSLTPNKLHYLKVCNIGYEPIIQFYRLFNQKYNEISPLNLHPCISQNYAKVKSTTLHYHQLFCKQTFKGEFLKDSQDQQILKGVFKDNKFGTLIPRFDFAHSSLMIVGSEKKTVFIKKFMDTLLKEKKKFSLQKVFDPIARNCGRKIFFLSHEDKNESIRSLLNKYDKGKNIRFIPMEKCLRVPVNKITENFSKQFKSLYETVFPEKNEKFREYYLQAKMSNGQIQECLFYEFINYSCAILGYIIMQVLNIKPFILKYVPTKGNIKKDKPCNQI